MQRIYTLMFCWVAIFYTGYLYADPTPPYSPQSNFDLPEQALNHGLIEFALQAKTTVIAPSQLLKGYRTTPIIGPFNHHKALALLIAKAPLQYSYDATHKVYVLTSKAPIQAPPQQQLTVSAPITPEETIVLGQQFPFYYQTLVNSQTRNGVSYFDAGRYLQLLPLELIHDIAPNNLTDALHYSSGITPGDGLANTNDDFYVRGFQRQAMHVDGFKLSDKTAAKIAPETIEKIEIIKGPSSLFYGQTEPGGLVNAIRKKPHNTNQNQLTLSTTTNNTQKLAYDGNFYSHYAGGIASRIIFVNDQHQAPDNSDAYNRQVIAPSLRLTPLKNTQLNITFEHQKIEQGLNTRFPIFNANNGFIQDRTLAESLQLKQPTFTADVQFLQGNLHYAFHPQWRLGLNYLWQEENRYGIRPANNEVDNSFSLAQDWLAPLGTEVTFLNLGGALLIPLITRTNGSTYIGQVRRLYNSESHETGISLSMTLDGKFTWGGLAHNLATGADFYSQDIFAEHTLETRPSANNSTIKNDLSNLQALTNFYLNNKGPLGLLSRNQQRYQLQDMGFYAQWHTDWNTHWATSLGGRYAIFNGKYTNFTSSHATHNPQPINDFSVQWDVVYRPIDDVSLFINYSQGIKTNDSFNISGQNYGPQKASQIEAGAKWFALEGKLIAAVAAFNIQKNNVINILPIDTTLNTHGDINSIQNTQVTNWPNNLSVSAQQSQGIEFDATYHLGQKTHYIFSAALINTNINQGPYKGKTLPLAPTTTLGGFLRHNINHQWAITTGIHYAGERYADLSNSYKLGSYALADAGVIWSTTWQTIPWETSLRLRNLTDDKTPKTTIPGLRNNETAGRNWQLMVKATL